MWGKALASTPFNKAMVVVSPLEPEFPHPRMLSMFPVPDMNSPREVGLQSNQKVGSIHNHLYHYCSGWHSGPGASTVKQSGSTAELGLSVLILLSNFSSWKGRDTSGLVLTAFLRVLQAEHVVSLAKGSRHLERNETAMLTGSIYRDN